MKNNNRLEHKDDILGFCKTLSILYIEDDKDIREHTAEIIEMIFGTNCTAINGEDGLKEYIRYYNEHNHYFDIVLTDLGLPVLSGIELSKEILKLNQEQLIIVNSGYNQVEVLTDLVDLGIYFFLPKPLTFKHLYQTLQKVASYIYDKQMSINNIKEIESLQKLLKKSDDSRQKQNKIFHNISKDIKMSAEAIRNLSKIASDITIDKKGKEYLGKIKNSSDHILALANNIQAISISESDDIAIEHIEFNINNIFDNISTTVVTKAHEKGLVVVFDINNNVPAIIKGDPLRLSQVLMILMDNAVKYTQSGEIILKVKMSPLPKDNKLLIFEVIDSGIGFKHDEQLNLLKQNSNKFKKSSLGIAKDIIKMMGGTIRVESRLGAGSRFIFSIVTQQVNIRSYRLPSKSLMFKKVLIVDNNPKSSLALSQMLQYFRYDTKVTFDLQEADRLFFEDSNFDIICMDRNFLTKIENEAFMSENRAKIILIEDNILQHNRDVNNAMHIDAKIYKPYTQKMIFDMIVELYEDEIKNKSEKVLTKDDIKDLSGSHILIIEYKTIVQNAIYEMLKDTGIKLTMTSSVNDALSLSKNLIDLDMILMDIYPLSSKDSEIIAEIQQDSRYANTPKVALLADNSKESIDEVTKKDFVSYICKPIVAHELYKILKDSITPKAKATIDKEMSIGKKIRPSIVDKGKNHYDLKDLGFNLCENEKRFREFYVVAKNSDKKVKALLNINRRNKAIELLESVKLAAINICATTLVDTVSHLIETIDINSEKSYLLSHRFAENLEIVMKKIEMLEKEPIKR